MCFYITATLPGKTKIESLKKVFEESKMVFNPIRNKFVESQIRIGEKYFRITKDYCDCNTILGAFNIKKEYQTLMKSKKVKALKKRKWTDEQIDAWINEKIKNKEMPIERKLTKIEKEEKINRWLDFLHTLLDNKLVSRIGLLKHWYNSGLEDEEFQIKKIEKVKINSITSEILLDIDEDVLYEFFPSYTY